jgi:YD repeat-containing protein
MKTIALVLFLLAASISKAQYYYKDLIGTRESSDMIKTYQRTGVTRVRVASYDAENTRNDDFFVEQTFSKPHNMLRTITRSGLSAESILTTYTDGEGNVLKTIDSSEAIISTTEYQYDGSGQLVQVKSSTTDSARRINETEIHRWEYNNGLPVRMLRLINNSDTTVVAFKLEGGNVAEEQSTRRGIKADPVYYYYNAAHRLTDIVRYNRKAKRLLPEYMFEYAPDGKVIQKITVPANSSDYLIWRYQYDGNGLKTREAIYDRRKTLTGKIEYQYVRAQ